MKLEHVYSGHYKSDFYSFRNEIVMWDFVDSKCSAQSHVFIDAFKTFLIELFCHLQQGLSRKKPVGDDSHMYIQAGLLSVSWCWDSSYGHVTAMLAITPWD